MKFTKGMYRDTRPINQPAETYRLLRNGVKTLDGIQYENGMAKLGVTMLYHFIGFVEVGIFKILFTTDDTNSAIYLFNTKTKALRLIQNDAALSFKWGFKRDFYITGRAKVNNQDEVTAVFTDKNLPPRYINCEKPPVNIKETYQQLTGQNPTIELYTQEGGNLRSGVYFVAVSYKNDNSAATEWSELEGPVSVYVVKPTDYKNSEASAADTLTTRAIRIKLDFIDLNFKTIKIAIVPKINDILSTTAYVKEYAISVATQEFIIPSVEGAAIPLQDIVIKSPVLTKIKTFGNVDNELFGGNVEVEFIPGLQQYVNTTVLKWVSQIDNNEEAGTENNNLGIENQYRGRAYKRGFMHGEVYNFYLAYKLTNGNFTQACHIPGRVVSTTQAPIYTEGPTGTWTESFVTIPEDMSLLDFKTAYPITGNYVDEMLSKFPTAKYFQIYDTALSDNTSISPNRGNINLGTFGFWQNEDGSKYENVANWDVAGSGEFRDDKIRHHRFPSISMLRKKLYNAQYTRYGHDKFDILGVKIISSTPPPILAGRILQPVLLWAKRSDNNFTVDGIGVSFFNSRKALVPLDKPFSTGGNTFIEDSGAANLDSTLKTDSLRYLGLDHLYSNKELNFNYTSVEFSLSKSGYNLIQIDIDKVVVSVNYEDDGALSTSFGPTVINNANKLRTISTKAYVPNNVDLPDINNSKTERGVILKLDSEYESTTALKTNLKFPRAKININRNTPSIQIDPDSAFSLLLIAACKYSNSIHPFLYSVELVKCYRDFTISNDVFFGGDVYVADTSLHTYGDLTKESPDVNNQKGIKMAYRFLSPCVNNFNMRYKEPGDINVLGYQLHYPKDSSTLNNLSTGIAGFFRHLDPNTIKYDRTFTTVNDLNSVDISNPNAQNEFRFPYRVVRFENVADEVQLDGWRILRPLAYLDSDKTKGQIIHLQGYGRELLIQHERSLFITESKASFSTESGSVFLGSPDIFQNKPTEIIPTDVGFAGTRHDLACCMTPNGYVTVNDVNGEIYLYNGKLTRISPGLSLFYRDNLLNQQTAGEKLAYTNIYKDYGIICGYDPYFKRMVLTNKKVIDSYTISFNMEQNVWASSHDYLPNALFFDDSTLFAITKQTTSVGNDRIYHFDKSVKPGQFFTNGSAVVVSPMFIDIGVSAGKSVILDSIQWVTEAIDKVTGMEKLNSTFAYITVWNNEECTGRILLTDKNIVKGNQRSTGQTWSFNDLRNAVINQSAAFVNDSIISSANNSITANIDQSKAWFKRSLFEGNYFVIRLEYSNFTFNNGYDLFLNEIDFKISPTTL